MRNKWLLSCTHEGGRYAYQGFSGGLYQPTTTTLSHSCAFSFPPLPLPVIFVKECGNAVRPGIEGKRDKERGKIRGGGVCMVFLGADRSLLYADTFSRVEAD